MKVGPKGEKAVTGARTEEGRELMAPDASCSCVGTQPSPHAEVQYVPSGRKGIVYVN